MYINNTEREHNESNIKHKHIDTSVIEGLF